MHFRHGLAFKKHVPDHFAGLVKHGRQGFLAYCGNSNVPPAE